MKNYLVSTLMVVVMSLPGILNAQDKNFGAVIDSKGALAMGDLMKQMSGKEQMEAKVEGKVEKVCQAKGCWMTIEKGDGSTMRVTFKDYGFFVPKNIAGKTVVIQGVARVNTTSVAELKHYAEDAKKSKEEIAAITEPKTELVFEADGVLLK